MRVCVHSNEASAKQATAWLKTWTDGGKMHAPLWKTVPGGQKTIKYYVCAAHLLCTVKVCVRQGGAWGVYADADRSHATDNNYMTRTNAALTYSQETEVKHAIEYYGASPGQLLHAAQGIALGNGASELDEKGVEGTCCTCQPALAVCTAPRRHPHSTRAAQLVGRFACAFRCALLCRRETSSRTRGPRYHPEVQLGMGQPTGAGRQEDRRRSRFCPDVRGLSRSQQQASHHQQPVAAMRRGHRQAFGRSQGIL